MKRSAALVVSAVWSLLPAVLPAASEHDSTTAGADITANAPTESAPADEQWPASLSPADAACLEHVERERSADGEMTLETALCLGTAYGRTGNYEKAVTYLSAWERLDGPDSLKSLMRGRALFYEGRLFDQIVSGAIAAENASERHIAGDSIVAVLPFHNVEADSRLDPLRKGLAEMVITDLAQLKDVTVVERTRMHKLLTEIGLDQAGVTANADKQRVAGLLAASRLVGGMFKCPDSSRLLIRGGFVDMRDSSTTAVRAGGSLEEFFAVEKDFVFALIDQMGIIPTDTEREAIESIKTENLLAFLAYSRGLDARDRGDYPAASAAFAEAARLDPSFEEAANLAAASREAVSEHHPETPEEQVDEQPVAEEAPVAFEGSGPRAVVEAAPEPAPAPRISPSEQTAGVRIVPRVNAASRAGTRSSSLAGASFMPEMGVHTREIGTTEESRGDADVTTEGSVLPEETRADRSRAAYPEYRGLGFSGATKQTELIVELPEEAP